MNKDYPEPFGYFRAEPFGWTDCAETDEGATPLYEQSAIDELGERLMVAEYALKDVKKQRDELLAALKKIAATSGGLPSDIAISEIARAKGGAA